MDIREFYKSNQQNQSSNSTHSNHNSTKSSADNKGDFSQYQDTINKYKDLSQEQLYSELLSQASDLKSQGKLDTKMLDQISYTLGPMLNTEQQQLLTDIISKIK